MNEKNTVTLSRDELFQMVWEQPVAKWSKKFGLSDVGFAKICRKMKIPLPGRGHWAMVAKGLKINPPPLKTIHDQKMTSVKITIRDPQSKAPKEKKELDPLILSEMSPENRIIVPDRIHSLHPLVKKTKILLNSRSTDNYSRIYIRNSSCLNMHVSRTSLSRAIRIMDTLIKALEKRGMSVMIMHENVPNITVSVKEEKIEIALEERGKIKEIESGEFGRRGKNRHNLLSDDRYRYETTGELAIVIKTYTSEPIRKQWKDTKLRKIEECLNEFIVGLIKAADAVKHDRLKREIAMNERRARERLYAEMQKREAEEREKYNMLIKQVNAWTNGRNIIKFVEHVKDAALKKFGKIETGSDLENWITYASDIAERLDPTFKIIE